MLAGPPRRYAPEAAVGRRLASPRFAVPLLGWALAMRLGRYEPPSSY